MHPEYNHGIWNKLRCSNFSLFSFALQSGTYIASDRSWFYCSHMTRVEPCGFWKNKILFCTNVENGTALRAQNDFLKFRVRISSQLGIEPTTEHSTPRLNNKEKDKVRQTKHNYRNPKRLKTRIETNKTTDTTQRRVQMARDLSVHEEPVSSGIIPHPFLFVILSSLGSQARFFSQNPFLAFPLSAHLSIL